MVDLAGSLQAALGDRYQLDGELGRGGMAVVFRAQDLRHHRPVAIKTLLPEVAAAFGPDRFLQEIELASQLVHPNIVPIFDSGVLEAPNGQHLFYYVMPVIEGESLRARLERERQLPAAEALAITRDVGGALAHAHAHGTVHRDVKPENILLMAGRALLMDFGIARATDGRTTRLTATGMAVGTPAYMSPEQAAGDRDTDARTDEYALATVLYEMLGGETPFSGPSPQAMLVRQLEGTVRPLVSIRPGLGSDRDHAIQRALSPNPHERYATVNEFLTALEEPSAGARVPWSRGRIKLLVGGVIAVALSVTIWQVVARQRQPTVQPGFAIMPFRASEAAAELGETLPDLLATTLQGTPGLKVPDPWALWRSLRPRSDARATPPDPVAAERLARRAGVARFVLGQVTILGVGLNVEFRIYGVGADPVVFSLRAASPDSATELIRSAAVEIIKQGLGGEAASRAATIGQSLSRSPEAVKAYLVAREAMRRGLVDSADASITRAITIDSSFGLALTEAVVVRSWTQFMRGQPFRNLRELAERARAHSDSLNPRNKLRLDAVFANVETNGRAAARAYQAMIERDSMDVEAWDGLAFVHTVYGWQYGATVKDAVATADRALALDSTFASAVSRRAHLSPELGIADVRQQIERLRARGATGVLRPALRGLEAIAADERAYPALEDSVAAGGLPEWTGVFRRLRAYRPDRALSLIRKVAARAGIGQADYAWTALGYLQVGTGQPEQLDSTLAKVGEGRALSQFLFRASVLAAAVLGVDDSVVTREAAMRLGESMRPDSAAAWIKSRSVWRTGWTLGAYHATRGDTVIARRWVEALAALEGGGSPPRWNVAEANDIRSRIWLRAGVPDSALARARAAVDDWPIRTENTSDDLPEPGIRFSWAEQLLGAGKPDSAAALFRSMIAPTTWLGSYTARSLLHLAEIAEATGNRVEAGRRFDQALQIWELGGPAATAWRRRAEAGLARVGNKPLRFGTP